MNLNAKHLLAKTLVWLLAEICLNYIGIDDLADYSEFIFDTDVVVSSSQIFAQKEKKLSSYPMI